MAYQNKRDRNRAIQKVRIEIGKLLGCETDAEAVIDVREPNEFEILKWREAQQESHLKGAEYFRTLLTDMIVDHNLMEDEKDRMKIPDVVDLICAKNELFDRVLTTWTKQVFRSQLSKKEGK